MTKRTTLAIFLVLVAAGCAKKRPVAQSAPANPVAAERTATPTPSAPARQTTATPAAPQQARRTSDDDVRKAVTDINKALEDAFFDFDKYTLRAETMNSLTSASSVLKDAMSSDSSFKLNVEGHADERGSSEYNLALGDRRAQQVKEFLVQLGIPGERIATLSQGEERPACTEQSEDCWQKNRRAHVDYTRN
jgi:peptidoglycan-associated lipoprotein